MVSYFSLLRCSLTILILDQNRGLVISRTNAPKSTVAYIYIRRSSVSHIINLNHMRICDLAVVNTTLGSFFQTCVYLHRYMCFACFLMGNDLSFIITSPQHQSRYSIFVCVYIIQTNIVDIYFAKLTSIQRSPSSAPHNFSCSTKHFRSVRQSGRSDYRYFTQCMQTYRFMSYVFEAMKIWRSEKTSSH